MENKIYRKIGRKFVQVSDDDCLSMYLRDGFYLVHAYEAGRSISRIEPDRAALQAAMSLSEEAMVKAMQEAATMKPYENPKRPLSRKERRAYAAYEKIMGKGASASWTSESLHGIVEAGIKAISL